VVGGVLADPALRRLCGGDPVLTHVLRVIDDAACGLPVQAREETLEPPSRWSDTGITPEAVRAYFEDLESGRGALSETSAVHMMWTWVWADLCDVLWELIPAVLPLLDDEDPTVRLASLQTVTALGGTPRAAGGASELAARFESRLRSAEGRNERASLVIGLGEMGGDTRPWLVDDDPAIRACSACYLPNEDKATQELISALTAAEAAQGWFAASPWRHRGHVAVLLGNLVGRDLPFDELLPVALSIARTANPWFPDDDWGLLLRRAFPDVVFEPGVQPPPPKPINPAQRAYVLALTLNEALWDPANGNARLARMRVGLPHTQAEVLALLEERPPPRRRWSLRR